MTSQAVALGGDARAELSKVLAFVRRDAVTAWSYRISFFTEWANLAFQAVLFYMVGRIVNPASLPTYAGTRATYMEFVAVGIAMSVFVAVAVARVSAQLRNEQLAGTLEALLLTPTTPATIQIGSVAYDLLYIPLRMALFLLFVALGFGLHFRGAGVAPAALIMVAFIPFAWGLGIIGAATTLTVRRGTAVISYLLTALMLGSGSYYPIGAFPGWLQAAARVNPLTIAVDGMRRALLAGLGGSELLRTVGLLAIASACSVSGGALAFRIALRRERRRGTLGQY